MAKKKVIVKSENRDTVKFCAFWGLAISAISYAASGVINFLIGLIGNLSTSVAGVLSNIASIFSLLGSVALLIAIALPAWGFVKYKSNGWKVFYWVCLIIYALGVVFGVLPRFI